MESDRHMSTSNSLPLRDCQATTEPVVEHGRYVTDGTHLYRRATEAHADNGFVWLEDCHSLELMRVTAHAAGALRVVPTQEQATDE